MLRSRSWMVATAALLALGFSSGSVRADDKKAGDAFIPVFNLNGALIEAGGGDDAFSFSGETPTTLRDFVANLKKAAGDSTVKAVVIFAENAGLGNAQIEEVRQAMENLQKAGKPIYTHADSMDMKGYILLSGVSRISMVPTADLWILGMHGEAPYLRGLLNLLGVKPDFLTCGSYKSAAEMYLREGPSKEAEEMQNWLLDSMFETDLKLISSGRKVEVAKAKEWINNGPYTAEKAKAAGIIDAVEHRQDFENMLKDKYGQKVKFEKKYGKKKAPKLDFSNPFAMFKIMGDILGDGKKSSSKKPGIAIVYVDGGIDIGSGKVSPFGTTGASAVEIRKALDEVAKDDAIKAVVLRVDSPGGSAVASEIILDATRRVKAKKPFVVSMGDVAGSGGYYVACASDVIFADASTITGSIGVVGGKMVTTGLWEKAGIHFKEYKRGQNAGIMSSSTPFSPTERVKIQNWMDEVYGVFKGHVEASRGTRLKKPLEELAGGRVYTGSQALKLGLVDKIGTMQDAIEFIAAQAKTKDYEIRVVPEPKSFIEKIMEELTGDKDEPNRLVKLQAAHQVSLIDLAQPYLKQLDPTRVRLVTRALQNLQVMQRDGATLMMPELGLGK
ncbi:S49 family peptidase [soil metagenome]